MSTIASSLSRAAHLGKLCGVGLMVVQTAFGQSPQPAASALPLSDLSAFRKTDKNWRIAGDVSADLNQNNVLNTGKGTGILVNLPDKKANANLMTNVEHGDADLELDYMMAKGSNSGIYLQGRYEVQLFDSWGVKNPRTVDNGSIYERWDESRPEGQKGYEGHPARMNASRAPGLWQHLKISFQAPRFNAAGQKTSNARMLLVELNGVPIHENVELTGPTRGALFNDEKPTGPLMIQGDHGPVAFRNVVIKNFDKPRPQLNNLQYAYYTGKYNRQPDLNSLPPEAKGPTDALTVGLSRSQNEFVLRFTGDLNLAESGEYQFQMATPGGFGTMLVDGKPVLNWREWGQEGKATLAGGRHPVEIIYSKITDWARPGLGLLIAGPGVRPTELHQLGSMPLGSPTNPILMSRVGEPTVHRSFLTIQGRKLPHAVSVGDPSGIHYSMDLENGSIAQVWKGDFMDVTPMWEDRGNGMALPMGSVMVMAAGPTVAPLADANAAWPPMLTTPEENDTKKYRFRGYDLDAAGRPTFRYEVNGVAIEDQIRPDGEGKFLTRELRVAGAPAGMYVRLAAGTDIAPVSEGLFVVDGKYYVRTAAKPTIRNAASGKELVMPVGGTVQYEIMW